MTSAPSLIFFSLFGLTLTACEPLDGGGGGGIGGRLAFVRSGALLVSLDDGNGERTLTQSNTSAEPALSPTGATIAFAYSPEGDDLGRGIYTVGFATGSLLEPLALPDEGQTFSSPAWSPDGSTVVFVSSEGPVSTLLQVAGSGGEVSEVVPGLTDVDSPAFLDPDTLLVRQRSSSELQSIDLTTGALTPLGISTPARAAVSPDGTRIAYADEGSGGTVIVVQSLDTGAQTPLATTGGLDTKPAFSFDGSAVAFESNNVIYVAASDGTGLAEVLQSGYDIAWAP